MEIDKWEINNGWMKGACRAQRQKFGTEYKTIHEVGNIKFVVQNEQGSQKAPIKL